MAWFIILVEGLTIILSIIFANGISFFALCMGRRELFYSYDYFYQGGFSKLQGSDVVGYPKPGGKPPTFLIPELDLNPTFGTRLHHYFKAIDHVMTTTKAFTT